jgi:HTH-type transcriptional regulator, sugar sensing transcriptional regulator
MDYRELAHLGLSEKEAKVYLSALELGKSSVQNISKKAEVNRATTYVIIESLMKKGLMSSIDENKKQFFMAEPPEKLKMLFQHQEMEIIRKLDYLDKMLPELRAINSRIAEKPIVKYYEGKDGMLAMADDFFMNKIDNEARMIFSNDLLGKILGDEERNKLRNKRQRAEVNVRAIINDEHSALKASNDRVLHSVPTSIYPISADIAIYGNKIRIAPQKGALAGILIENNEVSETLKILFDLAWKYLEHQKKEKGT